MLSHRIELADKDEKRQQRILIEGQLNRDYDATSD
jgi:hypothetical protein